MDRPGGSFISAQGVATSSLKVGTMTSAAQTGNSTSTHSLMPPPAHPPMAGLASTTPTTKEDLMRNAMKMGPHASPWRSSSAIVPPRPASHPPPCAPEKKKEEEAQLDLAAVAGAASFASNRIRAMTSTPGSPLTPARPSSTSHHSRARSVSSVPQEELLPPDAASGGTSPFPFNIPLSPKVPSTLPHPFFFSERGCSSPRARAMRN